MNMNEIFNGLFFGPRGELANGPIVFRLATMFRQRQTEVEVQLKLNWTKFKWLLN